MSVWNITPSVKAYGMSEAAKAVARYLAENSKQGKDMDPKASPDHLRSATRLSDEGIREAADELRRAGLVALHPAIGMGRIGFCLMTPTGEFFEAFDSFFGLGDPFEDARTWGAKLLEKEKGGSTTQEVADALGWSARRVNPAINFLITHKLVMASRRGNKTWLSACMQALPGLKAFVGQ